MNIALATADDADLVTAVRQGDTEAFGLLYQRHLPTISAYARRRTRALEDAGDLVAESFARLLVMLQRGRGPEGEVAPYLTRIVRNMAIDKAGAARRLEITDEPTVLEQPVPFRDVVVEEEERALARSAFALLPERWQRVLWFTTVLECPLEEAAAAMGLSTNALTSLAYRAREGLRQAYLQAHVPAGGSSCCASYRARLGSYVRGGMGDEPGKRMRLHLDSCASCQEVEAELADLNSMLREHPLATVLPGPKTTPLTAVPTRCEGVDDGWAPNRVA